MSEDRESSRSLDDQLPSKSLHHRPVGLWTLALLLATCNVLAAGSSGDEFLINQLSTGDQQSPDVAAFADGGFLVVWQSPVSPGNDTSNHSIVARRLDGDGSPAGSDFQINTYTTYSQRRPKVASRADSSFVVVWQSFFPGGKGFLDELRGRSFDSVGDGLTSDFTVVVSPNIYTSINTHDVGAASDGDFVVASSRFYYYNGNYSGSARLRRLESDGTQLSSTSLGDNQGQVFSVQVGGDDSTGFVVSTHRAQYFGQYNFAHVQRLDTSGVFSGSSVDAFADQTFGIGGGTGADAVLAPDGAFVIAWNGYDVYQGTGTEIYGRGVDAMDVFDPAGVQQVNSYTTSFQHAPRLARSDDGTILAVWETTGAPDDPGQGVRARWLTSDGSPLGDEMVVNTYTTGNQRGPEVAVSADGQRFLVVWNSAVGAGGDVDGQSIRGRIFTRPGMFQDGFESGTTAAWSSASP